MAMMLAGAEGVVCLMYGILVYDKDEGEYQRHLEAVMHRLKQAKITINADKCQFAQSTITFLGQIINQNGIQPDPDKVRAITALPLPTNVPEVRRFMGMVNQLSKFYPQLADKAKPINDFLSGKNDWNWGDTQQKSFNLIKNDLSSVPIFALYNPKLPTAITADALSYGLRVILTQQQPIGENNPIAYVSRALTSTEQRYPQIEKEALALTWACKRLSNYLIKIHFHIHTDHKSLIPLLWGKNLDELPTADMLSRSPINSFTEDDINLF